MGYYIPGYCFSWYQVSKMNPRFLIKYIFIVIEIIIFRSFPFPFILGSRALLPASPCSCPDIYLFPFPSEGFGAGNTNSWVFCRPGGALVRSDAVSPGCLFKQIMYRVLYGSYFAGVNIIKQNFSLSCSPVPACLLTNHLISAAPREGSEPDGELVGRRNRQRIKAAALQAAMLAPRAGAGGDVGTLGDSPGADATVRPGSQPSPEASPGLWGCCREPCSLQPTYARRESPR